jgi:hypothetical protein
LLACIAFLQIYGQARNNRERIKTEDRITEQTTLLIAIGSEVDEQGSLLEEQGSLLRRIADGIAAENERQDT